MKPAIYVASKVTHAPMWRSLREAGVPIVSTWIDEAGEGETKSFSDLAVRCIREVIHAGVVILYCRPGELQKGALIEVGAALAARVPVLAVGAESVSKTFIHYPIWIAVPDLREALIMAESVLDPNGGRGWSLAPLPASVEDLNASA